MSAGNAEGASGYRMLQGGAEGGESSLVRPQSRASKCFP